jgi:predicted N-acetyltransferase YhbS
MIDMEQAIVYLTHRSCHHKYYSWFSFKHMSHHSVRAGSSIIDDTCTVLLRLLALVVEKIDVRK